MAVTAQDIRDHFDEFSDLSDTVINRWKLQAERRVNLVQWGEKADDAILWLTGHLLKLHQQIACGLQAGSGPITSRRAGDLAVTYKVPDKLVTSFLASTSYGRYYLELMTGIWPQRVLGACCT